jgi:hypothetical protein
MPALRWACVWFLATRANTSARYSLILSLPTSSSRTRLMRPVSFFSKQYKHTSPCFVLLYFCSTKAIPWFVSDVTPPDFLRTPEVLVSPTFFSESSAEPSAKEHLTALVTRWQRYIADGTFRLPVPLDSSLGVADPKIDFWTSPSPYWNMEVTAPELFKDLMHSGLVIFKVRVLVFLAR